MELSTQKYKQQDIFTAELFIKYAEAVDDIRSAIPAMSANEYRKRISHSVKKIIYYVVVVTMR